MAKKNRDAENHGSHTVIARQADAIDHHVGKRLREFRRAMDLSQQELSEKIGISYQQVQKYESGANRISASRLYMFAEVLSVPIQSFYDGYRLENGAITLQDQLEIAPLENPDVRNAVDALVRTIVDLTNQPASKTNLQ